jgi:hypothetical protein
MLRLDCTAFDGHTRSCSAGRAGCVLEDTFVSARASNGKQGYSLHSHRHWVAYSEDDEVELSIYISTLILEYFGGSIET